MKTLNKTNKSAKPTKVSHIITNLGLCQVVVLSISLLGSNQALAISPFAPVPLYLQTQGNVKPNIMFMLDVTGSMSSTVGGVSRINIAKQAIKQLIDNNDESVRMGFGFFPVQSRNEPVSMGTGVFPTFPTPSASGRPTMLKQAYHSKIDVETVDLTPAHKTKLKAAVDAADMIGYANNPWASSPGGYYVSMSSAVAEITRYFRGLSTVQNNEDPRLNLRTKVLESKPALVNVNGVSVTYKSPIQYSCQYNFAVLLTDGEEPWYYPYLAQDPLFQTMQTSTVIRDDHGNITRNYAVPLSSTEAPAIAAAAFMRRDLNNALVSADGITFRKMDERYPIMSTYTVGFGQAVPLSNQVAQAGGGDYYQATNANQLSQALENIFDSIKNVAGSTAPPSYISNTENVGAIGANFNSDGWFSTLVIYPQTINGTIETATPRPVVIPTGTLRNVWYKSGSTAVKLSGSADTSIFGVDAVNAPKLGKWLRGETTDYSRASALPGDILNSNISITHNGGFFVVGANDGMVHVFKQGTVANLYTEVLAYIPSLAKRASTDSLTVGKALFDLTRDNYGKYINPHRYFVDGGTFYRGTATDQHFVVGSTGRGGAGVYALNMKKIADATGMPAGSDGIVFDITNGSSYQNLGYTVGTPVIAKVNDGGADQWVALFGNGYEVQNINSAGVNSPTLYGVYMTGAQVGQRWKEITANSGLSGSNNKNGLSGVAVIDTNNDGYADYAYAGNLQGDLYRFSLKLNDADSAHAVKIFSGRPEKPITSAPVVFSSGGKHTIIFGTGSALYETDSASKVQQTVYGIQDDLSVPFTPITSANLQTQTFNETPAGIRTLSSEAINPATHKGWQVHLSGNTGERVIYQPKINGDTVFLSTQIITPAQSVCDTANGSGYIMTFDAATGGHPLPNNSHLIMAGVTTYHAGYKVAEGVPSDLGGALLPIANKNGVDTYGNTVPGLLSTKDNKDNAIMLPGRTYKNNDGNLISVGLFTSNGLSNSLDFMSKKAAKINNSKLRLLSWKEIF